MNKPMNGAESLVQTLLNGGVGVSFTNPGTSEMHFVAALDGALDMRCVLCLFEGVATGAADGYARMRDQPAATLLHLGPGLANGLANIHNAKRANSPMVNIIGDHATYHLHYDAPLTADIETTAKPYSHWIKRALDSNTVAADGAAAIQAANSAPGRIATLILPGDTAWNPAQGPASVAARKAAAPIPGERIEGIARILRSGEPCVLFLGNKALHEQCLALAGRICTATGAEMLTQTSNARLQRGAGRTPIERTPYPVPQALERLARFRHAILLGAKEPVAFFAYPDKPSRMLPEDCQVHRLAGPENDLTQVLSDLAVALGAEKTPTPVFSLDPPAVPQGVLTSTNLALCVAALLPENAIVADESVSAGRAFFQYIREVPAHDWIQITGGAIGSGPPLATGAAVACPDRWVINLQADGSAMYTLQALWTQAREQLKVITVILANNAYAILQGEMRNVGVGELGPKAKAMLELTSPELDWPSLARGMGVAAGRAETCEDFSRLFQKALAGEGPFLIEARI